LGQGLVKNQEISLVFQLDQDSSDKSNCGEAKLEIDYQLIDDATTKPLVFTCPIHLDAQKARFSLPFYVIRHWCQCPFRPQHLYEVQLEHADSAVVGSAIHVALHIIRLASSSQEEEVISLCHTFFLFFQKLKLSLFTQDPVFEVTSKEPWIVLGLRKAHFNLHVCDSPCMENLSWCWSEWKNSVWRAKDMALQAPVHKPWLSTCSIRYDSWCASRQGALHAHSKADSCSSKGDALLLLRQNAS